MGVVGGRGGGAGVEERLDAFGRFGGRARPRWCAVFHHDHPVAEVERVGHVLLDDEQRGARLAQAGRATRTCGRRSSARARATARRRSAASAASTSTRAIASMRCSPPDSVPAIWRRRSPSRGNNSNASSRPAVTPLRPRIRLIDSARFSSTVSVPNTERPSGAWATPARANSYAGLPVTSTPSTWIVPDVGAIRPGRDPGDRSSCRRRSGRRARPLRPASIVIDTSNSARNAPYAGVDVAELERPRSRRHLQVAEVGVAHLRARHHLGGRCRERSSDRSRAGSCRWVNDGDELDVVLDEQDREPTLLLHLAQRRRPAPRSRRGRARTTVRRGARAWAASSAPARPRRAGPARGSGVRSARRRGHASPSRSSISSVRATSSGRGLPRAEMSLHHCVRHGGPGRRSRRWSRTVESGNSSIRWNVRPMPSRARSWTRSPVMSAPSNSTTPPSVRRMPRMQLKNVVLPAPFGPISPTRSPSSTSMSTSSRATMPANFLLTPRVAAGS